MNRDSNNLFNEVSTIIGLNKEDKTMTTTTITTKREAMLNQINIYLARWSEDLINEMGSWFYFYTSEHNNSLASERVELARARFERDRAMVTEKVLDILESDTNRYREIKKLFCEYVVEHDAEDYAKALVEKYDHLGC